MLSTSSPRLGSPATAPRTALVPMPFMLPVVGTMTPLAFLTMLPLQAAVIFSGIAPKASLALAEARAMAIGSVQPRAGTSSSRRMRR